MNSHCGDDSWLAQWETLLQSNAISHWLGTNLESALAVCGVKFQHYTDNYCG